MQILPLHPDIKKFLLKRGLGKKFAKQVKFFQQNPFHKSLNTEMLEPKYLRIWSFRVDKKYRAIFIFRDSETAQVLDVNNHYK